MYEVQDASSLDSKFQAFPTLKEDLRNFGGENLEKRLPGIRFEINDYITLYMNESSEEKIERSLHTSKQEMKRKLMHYT